jgi:hypothetical protein
MYKILVQNFAELLATTLEEIFAPSPRGDHTYINHPAILRHLIHPRPRFELPSNPRLSARTA